MSRRNLTSLPGAPDRALTQIAASRGYVLSAALAQRKRVRAQVVSGEMTPAVGREVEAAVAAIREDSKSLLGILRALAPVYRRRLWDDFRAGWRAARPGRAGR